MAVYPFSFLENIYYTPWDIAMHWTTATAQERERLRQYILEKLPHLPNITEIDVPAQGLHDNLDFWDVHPGRPTFIVIHVFEYEHLYEVLLFPSGLVFI